MIKKAILKKKNLNSLKDKFCCVSWSGGKDSCLAMHRAILAGAKIKTIITMMMEDGIRSRSHGLYCDIIEMQAESLDVDLEIGKTSWNDYENNFTRILRKLNQEGIQAAIFGDIDLEDHLNWECNVCNNAKIFPVLPLWNIDRKELIKEFLAARFKAQIVSLNAKLLSPEYLGQAISENLLEKFESMGIDACGENGEFHTVVTDGPIFRFPIELIEGEKILRDNYWFLDYKLNYHGIKDVDLKIKN